jgi:Gti1/Pac2 family transcription factor
MHSQVHHPTVAYFTQESLSRLKVIDDFPVLASLQVPHHQYQSARHPKGRPEHLFSPQHEVGTEFVPYMPNSSPTSYYQPEPSSSGANLASWRNNRQVGSHQKYPSTTSSARPESPSDISDSLAPLAYLQTITPIRRHPEDEKTLMLLRPAPM